MVQLDRDQSEIDIRHFVICDGRARHHRPEALRGGVDADPLKTVAEPSRPPSAKRVTSHLYLMQELPSFVAPGVRQGRHMRDLSSLRPDFGRSLRISPLAGFRAGQVALE